MSSLKLSKFLIKEELGDNLIIKQLVTGSVIQIGKDDLQKLDNGYFDTIDNETLQDLIDCGFLVDGNENKQFLKIFSDWWQESNFLTLFVVPTNDCNCKCPYCYEDTIDRDQYMRTEVCEETLRWAEEYLQGHQELKELNLVFHGGEPLLNKKAVCFLLPKFSELCSRNNVHLVVNIVSNGVLLDRDIIEELSSYDLQRVQLTIDGLKDVHDARRALLSGSGTFNRIWKNMKIAISGGYVDKIYLRINIDKLNLDSVGPLLVAIKKDEILSENVKISLGIITFTIGCHGELSNAQKYVQENGLSGTDSAHKYLELIKLARRLGYEVYDEMMIGPWCAARHPHAWMIGPGGDIYKCACDLGRDDWRVGSIFGKADASKILRLAERRLNECLESGCELVPICGGGCLFDIRAEPGGQCRKEFLDIVNKGLMMLQAQLDIE